jgi:serine/threonine protein kinase
MFLRKKPKNLGTIDPTQLEVGDIKTRILRRYLIKNKGNKKFSKDAVHVIVINGVQYQFQLTHDIIHRERASNPAQDRFEVVSNDNRPIGKGAAGSFLRIEGTLVPDLGGRLVFKNSKSRGVKREEAGEETVDFEASVTHEYELTSEISDIHVKKPSIVVEPSSRPELQEEKTIPQVETAYTVMKRLPGEDLIRVLANDKNPLSTQERLHLSIQLLRKLQELFHDKNILHLDLKPLNIKYNRETGEVYIFDLGLGKRLDNLSGTVGGTPKYAPLEQLNANVSLLDKSTDSYAMGKILSEIWDMPHISKNLPPVKCVENAAKDTEFNREKFDEINDLDEKETVFETIQDMTRANQDERLPVEDALRVFEQINLAYTNKEIKDNEELKKIRQANVVGLEAWKACRQIKSTEGDTAQIIELINEKLGEITDEEACIKAFVDALGVTAFKECRSKKDIEEKLESLNNEFKKQSEKFYKTSASVERVMKWLEPKEKSRFYKLIKSVNDEFESADNTMKKLPPGIDEMVIVTEKMKKINARAKDKLASLDDVYQPGNKQQEHQLSTVVSLLMTEPVVGENEQSKNLADLRAFIKLAVIIYLDDTYTKSAIKKQDRAASQRRLDDMSEILKIVNDTEISTPEVMIKRVESRLDKVKRGLFGSNKFFLRSMGGSELVDNVNDAIKLYQKEHPKPAKRSIKN